MKSLNIFSKVLILSIVWTVVFLSLAGFAADKAMAQDPGILQRVQDKYNWQLRISGMSKGPKNLKETKDSWTFPADVKKVNLSSISDEIAIKQGTSTTFQLVATGELDSNLAPRLLEAEIRDDELFIKTPENEDATKNVKVYLEVPAEFQNDLKIGTISSKVTLENLNFKTLDLKSISGEFILQQLTANTLKIKTVSGNVTVTGSNVSNIDGGSVSGDFDFENRTSLAASITTVSGDIKMKLSKNDDTQYSLSSASGSIKNPHASSKNFTHEVKLQSASGDIELH